MITRRNKIRKFLEQEIANNEQIVLFGFIFKIKTDIYSRYFLKAIGSIQGSGEITYNKVITCYDDLSATNYAWLLRTQNTDKDLMKEIKIKSDSEDDVCNLLAKEYPSIRFNQSRDKMWFNDMSDLHKAINNAIDYVNNMYLDDSKLHIIFQESLVSTSDNAMSNYIKNVVSEVCEVSTVEIVSTLGRYDYGNIFLSVCVNCEKGQILFVQQDIESTDYGQDVSSDFIKSKSLRMIITCLFTEGISSLSGTKSLKKIETTKQLI